MTTTQETNGNGDEGGGVAVESPCRTEDLAAIMDELAKVPDETLTGIRRTFETYNDGTFDRFMAEHGADYEGNEDVVEAALPSVDKAILIRKIGKMLFASTVEFVAGIENFLRMAVEGAVG